MKKKSFRQKLLELCKTRAKKSSPDMFNFYVFSVGHDMVTDTGKADTIRCIMKTPSSSKKMYKKEGSPENMDFNWKN